VTRTIALFLTLFPLVVPAAENAGTVEGRVADAVTGRPISGATAVLLRDSPAQRTPALTDAQGRYVFSQVPEGLYSLEVEANDHVRAAESQVRVVRNKAATVNFTLARATSADMEEVVVSARTSHRTPLPRPRRSN
jgi:hypothetical protein